jgi:hypothetical protein
MPFALDQAAQERARRLLARKEQTRALWKRIAELLKRYDERYTPAARLHGREGWWVLIASTALLICNFGAAWLGGAGFWGVGAALIVADLLIVNTTIVFISRKPVSALRSAIFTFGGYVNLALAFAVGWVALGREECLPDRVLTAFYQSVRTLVTMGPDGDLVSDPTGWLLRMLTVSEDLIGIYFLSVVIANYASWAGKSDSPTEGA